MSVNFTRGDDFTLHANILNMSFSWDDVKDIRVALEQGDYVSIKTMSNGSVTVDAEQSTLQFTLPSEETINLKAGRLLMQLTFLINDIVWTNPKVYQIQVNELLNDEVIANE